jgi:hypothetical protein
MDAGILIWVLHPGNSCGYCGIPLGFDAGLSRLRGVAKTQRRGVTSNGTDIGSDIDQGCPYSSDCQMGASDDVADGGTIAVLRQGQAERQ